MALQLKTFICAYAYSHCCCGRRTTPISFAKVWKSQSGKKVHWFRNCQAIRHVEEKDHLELTEWTFCEFCERKKERLCRKQKVD